MSSPFHSQESDALPNATCGETADIEDSETKNSSQRFFTQISQPPTPKYSRQPLTPTQSRIHPDIMSTQATGLQDTSALLLARKDTQLPIDPIEDCMDTLQCTSDQVGARLQKHGPAQASASINRKCTAPTKVDLSDQKLMSVNDDHWPGGRTPLLNGRYLPRYVIKVSKDQQGILETNSAWQPSKAERQIRGSVPNQVLKDFTELAEKRPEIASTDSSLNPQAPAVTEEPDEGSFLDHGRDRDPVDAGSESSRSPEATSVSWSPTPRTSALPRPAFPDNSSPLGPPHRRVTPSLSRNDNSVASLSDASQQEQNVENGLSALFQGAKKDSDGGLETAACAQVISEAFQNTPGSATSEDERENFRRMSSLECRLSQIQDEGHLQGEEPSRTCWSQSKPDRTSQEGDLGLVARQSHEDLGHQNAIGNVLIQVQRTPFVHQLSRVVNGPEVCEHRSVSQHPNTDELVFNDQELKSSTALVSGTFMNVRTELDRQSKVDLMRLIHGESDCSEDERMEGKGRLEDTHLSRAVETVDAAFGAHQAGTSQSFSGSEEPLSQRRLAKRKYCGGKYGEPKIELNQLTEAYQQHSSPRPSKRPRTTTTFSSLDALGDIPTMKAPSEIARESRQEFFRKQQSAASRAAPIVDEMDAGTPVLSPHARGRKTPQFTRQGQTPPTSPLSRIGYQKESGVDTISRVSLRGPSLYDTYKLHYPEYQGNDIQFQKACRHIKVLHREGKAPHPSLWDDFVFRRHHDYRSYLLKITEACEDALPYLQYYMEHVEKPLRMRLIIKPSSILSLASDSATASSVQSPVRAVQMDIDVGVSLEKSVAVSSSAGNIRPDRRTSSPALAFDHRWQPEGGHESDSHQQDETRQVQDSSVKQRVETQLMEKVLGEESPELGYTDLAAKEEDVPQQLLDDSAEVSISSSPDFQPAASEQERKKSIWCDDPDTPFKSFARTYGALASERRQLRRRIKIDEKGCLKPLLQGVIDIFTS